MSEDTIRLALGDLEVPLGLVHELVKRHVLASLTPNGHAYPNGQGPQPEKEAAAPAPASSAGAP